MKHRVYGQMTTGKLIPVGMYDSKAEADAVWEALCKMRGRGYMQRSIRDFVVVDDSPQGAVQALRSVLNGKP